MRCPTCQYNLIGLTEHRCPECGNAFHPESERRRFDSLQDKANALLIMTTACAFYPILVLVSLFLTWVHGRVILGHWPQLYQDDPKFIPGLETSYRLTAGLLVCSFPVLVLNLLCALITLLLLWELSGGRLRGRAWLLLLALATWPGAVVILRFDPGGATTWFFD